MLSVGASSFRAVDTCEQLKGYRDHLATLGQDSDAEFTGEAYSVWDGSFAFGEYKEKALFVDENACIGCQVRRGSSRCTMMKTALVY